VSRRYLNTTHSHDCAFSLKERTVSESGGAVANNGWTYATGWARLRPGPLRAYSRRALRPFRQAWARSLRAGEVVHGHACEPIQPIPALIAHEGPGLNSCRITGKSSTDRSAAVNAVSGLPAAAVYMEHTLCALLERRFGQGQAPMPAASALPRLRCARRVRTRPGSSAYVRRAIALTQVNPPDQAGCCHSTLSAADPRRYGPCPHPWAVWCGRRAGAPERPRAERSERRLRLTVEVAIVTGRHRSETHRQPRGTCCDRCIELAAGSREGLPAKVVQTWPTVLVRQKFAGEELAL